MKCELSFCSLELHRDCVIATMKEGITVMPEYNDILVLLSQAYFKNRPFMYITNRKNSYSVNPMIYVETTKISNLIGFAVVSDEPIKKAMASFEELFFGKHFEVFQDMEEALEWKDKMMAKELAKKK